MKPEYKKFHDRQARVFEQAGVPPSVVQAMDCWAEWMKKGSGVKGYATHSVGFTTGGINCFDDMDSEAASYAARAVDGAVNSLDHVSRTCIGIVWLGHTIYYRRIDVEQKAAEAIRIIWRRLQVFGIA